MTVMVTVLLVALAFVVLGFIPLMGLPGALWLAVAAPIADRVLGRYSYDAAMAKLGPSTWALALVVTLLWPLALPAAFLLTRAFVSFDGWTARFLLPMGVLVVALATLVASVAAIVTVKSNTPLESERALAALRADDVAFLKAHGLPPREKGYDDPLYTAIAERSENVALWILESRTDALTFGRNGNHGSYAYSETPVSFAAMRELPKVFAMLVKRGADPNAKDSKGTTAAHAALGSDRGSAKFVTFLAAEGVRYDVADNEGKTPLMHLAQLSAPASWAVAVAEAMVKAGADPQAKDKDGKTAAQYARESFKGDLADFLDRAP